MVLLVPVASLHLGKAAQSHCQALTPISNLYGHLYEFKHQVAFSILYGLFFFVSVVSNTILTHIKARQM
ncbi:mCG148422, partial [Mus musculus]